MMGNDEFRIYYKNLLKDAAIDANPLIEGYVASNLVHDYRRIICMFSAKDAVITAQWSSPYAQDIEAICIADCNATNIHVKLENQSISQFEADFAPLPSGIQILILPNAIQTASKLTLTLSDMDSSGYQCGKIYAGPVLYLPRFDAGSAKETINITSSANRTRGGQVYGIKNINYRTFSASWSFLKNSDRTNIINYINNVQTVVPHFVEPYDTDYDPLYCVLNDPGSFTRRKENGMTWSGALTWDEAL
jgi:hypothetical protein